MPKVVLPGGKTKHYPYTKAGAAQAKKAAGKLGAKYVPARRQPKVGKQRRRKV